MLTVVLRDRNKDQDRIGGWVKKEDRGNSQEHLKAKSFTSTTNDGTTTRRRGLCLHL